jgi:hypothetical protein
MAADKAAFFPLTKMTKIVAATRTNACGSRKYNAHIFAGAIIT